MSAVRWMTWRCRLERSTVSSSITPRVPMPAAARYCRRGAPSPPAPTTSTLRGDQPRLAHAADLGQHDMARVAADLRLGQVGQRRHGPLIAWDRWHQCCYSQPDDRRPPTRPTLTPLLLVLLALLSSFTPLSIDMYLPALPVIAVDLHGTAGDIQLTLSAFMIAFGFGQIFYGPAGDRFGRRPVILGGLAIYVVTSIGCAFAAEAGHLVLLRFLQGLAACGGVVLARTMVRDLAEKDQAARAMSLMMACTSIAPMLAPLIGGQVLWFLGWRAIFWVLAVIGVVALVAGLCCACPRPCGRSIASRWCCRSILKRFGELLRHRAFMGYAFTSTFQFAALMSFLSGSPFVFIERYGVAPRDYGLIFGGMIVFMTIGSLLNARFVPVFGAEQHPALRRDRAGDRRPGGAGAGPDRGALRHHRHVAVPALLRAADRHHQPDRPQLHGDGAAALSAHGGHGLVADGRHAVRHRRALRRRSSARRFDGTIAPMTTAMGVAGLLCLLSNRLLVRRG